MTKITLAVNWTFGCDVTAPIYFGPARRNGVVRPNMVLQRTCCNQCRALCLRKAGAISSGR